MEASAATKAPTKTATRPPPPTAPKIPGDVAPPSHNPLPSLADFLIQINAGSSSSTTLPLEAQHSLIATQRANVRSSLTKQLSSQETQMRNVASKAAENRKSLRKLENEVDNVESAGRARAWSAGLIDALQEFRDAKQEKQQHERLIEVLEVMQRALLAIEALEETIAQGRLEDVAYKGANDAAEAACEPLTHGWLSADQSVRAFWDLQRRLRQCREKADQMLDEGWERSVQVIPSEAAASWTLIVMKELKFSSTAAQALRSASLLQALERKGKLKDRVPTLAAQLAERLIQSCLNESCTVRKLQGAGDSDHISLVFAPLGSSTPAAGLEALQLALLFIGSEILSDLPTKARQSDFARALLPRLVQPILTNLRATLPSRYDPVETISARLEQSRSLALSLCSSLASSGLLLTPDGAGPSDHSPEDNHLGQPSRIMAFAQDVGRQYVSKVANEARDEARRICTTLSLKDEKGWQAEEIEIASEEAQPLAQQMTGMGNERLVDEDHEIRGTLTTQKDTNGVGVGGGDEWQWGDDDGRDDPETYRHPAKAGIAPSVLNRSASSASQRSTASSGPEIRTAAPAARKRAGGRSALGGVRVVKPQDQMGSGPLPEGDQDDAWGFGDEDDAPEAAAPIAAQQARTVSSSLPPPPPPLGDEEDAWFAEEEPAASPPPPRAAERRSTLSSTSAAPSTSPVIAYTSRAPLQEAELDDEDAWFADEASRPMLIDHSQMPIPDSSLPVNTAPQPVAVVPAQSDTGNEDAWSTEGPPGTNDGTRLALPLPNISDPIDVDEDAWGLSEEEKAKRASMMLLGNHPTLQSLYEPSATAQTNTGAAGESSKVEEDDFDEDAWGLSLEEKVAKRASRLLPVAGTANVPAGNEAFEAESAPPTSTLIHPVEPSQARVEEPALQDGARAQEEAPLTEKNLETAAAEESHDEEAQVSAPPAASARPAPLGVSRPPSVVSSVSAIAPGSSRSDSARSTIAGVPTVREPEEGESALESAILADDVSVAGSDNSRRQPFPIESALPESLPTSEGAESDTSLPATPKTEGRATLSSGSSLCMPPSSDVGAIEESTTAEPFPVESAQSVSTASQAAPPIALTDLDDRRGGATAPLPSHLIDTAATPPTTSGPPSIASLPPTPSRERADPGFTLEFEDSSASRPRTPTLANYSSTSSEVDDDESAAAIPFPIRSAVPYNLQPNRQGSLSSWTESSSAPRTGPPSVVSDLGAASDMALPPSPGLQRADEDDGASGWGFDDGDEHEGELGFSSQSAEKQQAEDEGDQFASRGRAGTALPPRPPASLLQAVNNSSEAQSDAGQEYGDPWASLSDSAPMPAAGTAPVVPMGDSHPLTKEALQVLATERVAKLETQVNDIAEQEAPSTTAQAPAQPADDVSGWAWDEEADGTAPAATPSSAASAASPPAAVQSQSAVIGRVSNASPLLGARQSSAIRPAPPPATASELARATSRGSTQAGAAAGAGALAAGVAGAVATTQLPDPQPQHAVPQPAAAAKEAQTFEAPKGPHQETCRISLRSRQLVNLAHSLIDQAVALRSAHSNGVAVEIQPASLLDPALADIFDLHLALFTPETAAALQQVPALSMQFVNDCRFLSRQMIALESRVNKELPDVVADSSGALSKRITTAAQRTSLLATRYLTAHLSGHASHLANLIATGCDSFLSVYNDERFVSCSRTLSQALATVTSLDRSWRGTLGDSQRWTAVGALWEGAVVKKVYADVLALDDVGEKEGERLAELIRSIGDDKVAGWFTKTSRDASHQVQGVDEEEEEQKAAGHRLATYVPSHLKLTGYLPEMLIGSLADVEYLLFEGGALASPDLEATAGGGGSPWYVSREEAKGLIRATFADSRRRTDLLMRVARGV